MDMVVRVMVYSRAKTAVCARLYPTNLGRAVRPAGTQGDKNGTAEWYWLRSPKRPIRLSIVQISGGDNNFAVFDNIGGVRPALPEAPRQGSAPGRNAG